MEFVCAREKEWGRGRETEKERERKERERDGQAEIEREKESATRMGLSRKRGRQREALRGGIPDSFLEPLVRSWSHFGGIYRRKMARSL